MAVGKEELLLKRRAYFGPRSKQPKSCVPEMILIFCPRRRCSRTLKSLRPY